MPNFPRFSLYPVPHTFETFNLDRHKTSRLSTTQCTVLRSADDLNVVSRLICASSHDFLSYNLLHYTFSVAIIGQHHTDNVLNHLPLLPFMLELHPHIRRPSTAFELTRSLTPPNKTHETIRKSQGFLSSLDPISTLPALHLM